ncbi:MAG: tetratricopeptide repeat protein [Candidatus Heimdallarchaeota archaeon]|nr:MAG: tetratricopeptide repeat protein [Candidatus Heimdallarchaeota archaeon]
MPTQKIHDQTDVQSQVSTLKAAKDLLFLGKFIDALQNIDQLEKIDSKEDSLKIESQIYKSLILTRLGNNVEGLKLAEKALKETVRIKNQSLEIAAYISKITALLDTGDFDNSLEAIEEAERLQISINKIGEHDFIARNATLNYLKGKAFRKKGDLNRAIKHLEHSLTIQQDLGNKFEIADAQNDLGIIHATKGNLDMALISLDQSLMVFQELDLRQQIIKSTNNLGMIYGIKRDHNRALDYYQRSLALSEEIENKHFTAALSLNIGLIHRQKGDLTSALEFFEKAKIVFEELEHERELATCFNNIGAAYNILGEFNQALSFLQEGLKLAEKFGDKREISTSLQNIANVHEIRGDFDTAITYYKKSLEISEEIGSNYDIADLLYNLIVVSISAGFSENANFYLEKLSDINNEEKDDLINQKYRLSKAIVLRTSERLIKRAEAQQLFQDLAQEEILDIELTISALLNLCELLILELKTSGSEEVLKEVKIILERLFEMAEEQHSYLWLTEIYLLQAKTSLLELNISKAQDLINQAMVIAEMKGLNQLEKTISLEHDLIFSQLNKWNKIIEQKPSVSEVLELTQFEQFLERMVFKKIYCREEEIQEYAEKAQMLVEKWERGVSVKDV